MARSDGDLPRSLLTDRAFWIGLVAIALGLVVFALLFNYAVMPIWTRHDAAVEVPDVRELSPDDARSALRLAGLEGEEEIQPFNPNIEPDVVVDQSPAAGMSVKPGRRVYFYVNASPTGLVKIPDVTQVDTFNARSRLEEMGLLVSELTEDGRPGPTAGAVTSVRPAPGTQVPAGTRVRLTWSAGPDDSREVAVPDVVALPLEEARRLLEEAGFYVSTTYEEGMVVATQDPEAGERANPGTEVLLFD